MGIGSDRLSPLKKTFFLGGILKKANGRNFSLVLSNEDANESKRLESFLTAAPSLASPHDTSPAAASTSISSIPSRLSSALTSANSSSQTAWSRVKWPSSRSTMIS